MRSSLKRKLAIGATATAAVAFGGGAYAATQTGGNSRQAFLNDVAKRLNVSPQQLSTALKGAFDDQLAAAVAAGKITQAQANAIRQHMQQRGGAPLGFGGRHRFGGPRPFGAPGHPALHARGGRVSAAANYLGLTESQLLAQLASGKSLAQIAKARGKSVSGLQAAMSAAVKARLDKAVASKMLTSSQEQQLLKRMPSLLNAQINRRGYWGHVGGPGSRRGFAPRGGRVFPGFAPQGAPGGGVTAPPPPAGVFF